MTLVGDPAAADGKADAVHQLRLFVRGETVDGLPVGSIRTLGVTCLEPKRLRLDLYYVYVSRLEEGLKSAKVDNAYPEFW
jgi:hypothetical protein